MKILLAENLRFPGEGKSAQGQPGPKVRPKGVADGRQVNIPALLWRSIMSADRSALRKHQLAEALEAAAGGSGPEKSSCGKAVPVPKPTQVDEVNNLRRSR